MKFALLIFDDEEAWSKMGDDERAAVLDEHAKLYEILSERGAFVGGEQLAPTSEAVTVRTKGAAAQVAHAPHAVERETLGGFYVIDVASLEEAVDYAKRLQGTVEIRPIVEGP